MSVRALAAPLAALLLAACASTDFTSTWKAPDAGTLDYAGKKVAAIFISPDESTRRAGEDALAREISVRGAVGVPAYTVLSSDEVQDQTAARTKLQREGFAGVVTMRIAGEEQQISSTPGHYTALPYTSFSGYSHYGWGAVYEPGYQTTDTIVSVETLVYSLERDKLLWGGVSETFNPDDIEDFVVELADAVADELKDERLIR
jgi:hypothetical protein